MAGPVKVKWIKITDHPGDSGQKKLYFESAQGFNLLYHYFIVAGAAESGWARLLIEQYRTNGDVYYDPVGGTNVTFNWNDEYTAGGPTQPVSAPVPAPAHSEVANIRLVP
jgi:hypothetical protein